MFANGFIPQSPPVFNTPDAASAYVVDRKFDVLVCGSDQVWLIDENTGIDHGYFLDLAVHSNVRRISYAPSTGPMASFGRFSKDVEPILRRFDAISVRDANTASSVEGLGIEGFTRVLDPTLIADFNPLLSETRGGGDIVVIGRMNAAADDYIRFAAETLKCPVRAIGCRTPASDVQQPFASPLQWVNAVAGARLVITSLFHGAAVSLALRTPFVALDCAGRAFKLRDLTDHIGAPERLLTNKDAQGYAQDATLLEMSYDKLDATLAGLARDSRAFLSAAIDG